MQSECSFEILKFHLEAKVWIFDKQIDFRSKCRLNSRRFRLTSRHYSSFYTVSYCMSNTMDKVKNFSRVICRSGISPVAKLAKEVKRRNSYDAAIGKASSIDQ